MKEIKDIPFKVKRVQYTKNRRSASPPSGVKISHPIIQNAATNANEPPIVESQLREIDNFVTSSIWNEAFVNIGWYTKGGTDATGQEMDMELLWRRKQSMMPIFKDWMRSMIV